MLKMISTASKSVKFGLGSLAVLCVAVSFVSVLAQPYTPTKVKRPEIGFDKVAVDEHELFYAYSGNVDKPGVIFIHGTPGGWEAFEGYLESKRLQEDFLLVSVDRIGWGQSAIPAKEIDGNFAIQSQSIGAVMNQFPKKKWILVGHSLGASIAPQVAVDYPNQVSGLLLLAGSLKPSLGSPRWYNYAASTWVVASLIGRTMKYSNREIMGLKKQLRTMDKEIKAAELPSNLIVMQGMKDKLVSPKNSAYVDSAWKNNFASVKLVELENEGHFLPWRQAPLVVKSVYELATMDAPSIENEAQ